MLCDERLREISRCGCNRCSLRLGTHKNHLLMLGSIGAGGCLDSAGTSGLTLACEPSTVELALRVVHHQQSEERTRAKDPHRDAGMAFLDQTLPGLVALHDDLGGVGLVLGFARESELREIGSDDTVRQEMAASLAGDAPGSPAFRPGSASPGNASEMVE